MAQSSTTTKSKSKVNGLAKERMDFLSSCDPSLRQAIICLSAYANKEGELVRSQVFSALVCLGYPMFHE